MVLGLHVLDLEHFKVSGGLVFLWPPFIIVEFLILLLNSSQGNFFTNSHDTLHLLCLHHHHAQLQAIKQKYEICAFWWSFNWKMIKLANLVYCQIDLLSPHLIFMNVNPAKNIPEFLGDNSDSWVLSQRVNATLLWSVDV